MTAFSSALTRAKTKRKSSSKISTLPGLGSFDPAILAATHTNTETANNAQDTYDLNSAQAQDNYGIQTGRLGVTHAASLADLGTSHDRSLADLILNRTRAGENHDQSLADLAQSYQRLGRKQGEAARVAHVESTGILAQSLAKRQANQAHDQAPIDQGYSRFMQDSQTSQGRIGQDYSTAVGRENQNTDWQKADLLLGLTRNFGSGTGGVPLGQQTLALTQAKNLAQSNNLDLAGQAWQQAAANGYRIAPSRTPQRRRRLVLL